MASFLDSVEQMINPPTRRIDRVLAPVRIFLRHRLAGAGLLMLATLVAVVLANSPLEHAYHHFFHRHLELDAGFLDLDYSLHHWINDGLMSVFFFMVGLEIKRELLAGELSSVRKATLPAIAAVGGMVVPALIFVLFNLGTDTLSGWGIPMATDIAFALGVLALLGDRIPLGVKVFLTALAIVDDIGAVLVIAVFYTEDLHLIALAIGGAFWLTAILFNRLQVRSPLAYLAIGFMMWVAFLKSGVHATIAAILMAFTIPSSTRINGRDLVERLKFLTARLEKTGLPEDTRLNTAEQDHTITTMSETIDYARAPLQRIEHGLHGFVTFIVLPVFALANAGVTLHGNIFDQLVSPVATGIVLGLFLGKQLGITFATWLAVKTKLADLPAGVTWVQIHGANMLAGIGFTMSLFIAGLAYQAPEHIEQAKIGILFASLISGAAGVAFLRAFSRSGRGATP